MNQNTEYTNAASMTYSKKVSRYLLDWLFSCFLDDSDLGSGLLESVFKNLTIVFVKGKVVLLKQLFDVFALLIIQHLVVGNCLKQNMFLVVAQTDGLGSKLSFSNMPLCSTGDLTSFA